MYEIHCYRLNKLFNKFQYFVQWWCAMIYPYYLEIYNQLRKIYGRNDITYLHELLGFETKLLRGNRGVFFF